MVYLVDDDEDDLDIIKEALVMNSYKGPVRTAANGLALLESLNLRWPEEIPGVILMDLNMPLKDGFSTLGEIKGNPFLKDIPVIILTASTSKRDEARCFDLGCQYFYSKPEEFDDYRTIVLMVKQFLNRTP